MIEQHSTCPSATPADLWGYPATATATRRCRIEQNVALSAAIVDIAQARRRFGYRRIHDLLRPEFPEVNHKRVYRLYSIARLAVTQAQEGQAAGKRARAAADRQTRQ
jgi:hypothetical protein